MWSCNKEYHLSRSRDGQEAYNLEFYSFGVGERLVENIVKYIQCFPFLFDFVYAAGGEEGNNHTDFWTHHDITGSFRPVKYAAGIEIGRMIEHNLNAVGRSILVMSPNGWSRSLFMMWSAFFVRLVGFVRFMVLVMLGVLVH